MGKDYMGRQKTFLKSEIMFRPRVSPNDWPTPLYALRTGFFLDVDPCNNLVDYNPRKHFWQASFLLSMVRPLNEDFAHVCHSNMITLIVDNTLCNAYVQLTDAS